MNVRSAKVRRMRKTSTLGFDRKRKVTTARENTYYAIYIYILRNYVVIQM